MKAKESSLFYKFRAIEIVIAFGKKGQHYLSSVTISLYLNKTASELNRLEYYTRFLLRKCVRNPRIQKLFNLAFPFTQQRDSAVLNCNVI